MKWAISIVYPGPYLQLKRGHVIHFSFFFFSLSNTSKPLLLCPSRLLPPFVEGDSTPSPPAPSPPTWPVQTWGSGSPPFHRGAG